MLLRWVRPCWQAAWCCSVRENCAVKGVMTTIMLDRFSSLSGWCPWQSVSINHNHNQNQSQNQNLGCVQVLAEWKHSGGLLELHKRALKVTNTFPCMMLQICNTCDRLGAADLLSAGCALMLYQ